MLKVTTRGEYYGLTDHAHAGIMVDDYSQQKTPPNNDRLFKPKKTFGGSIQDKEDG